MRAGAILSEHKESGSAVMPKWFATLVLAGDPRNCAVARREADGV